MSIKFREQQTKHQEEVAGLQQALDRQAVQIEELQRRNKELANSLEGLVGANGVRGADNPLSQDELLAQTTTKESLAAKIQDLEDTLSDRDELIEMLKSDAIKAKRDTVPKVMYDAMMAEL